MLCYAKSLILSLKFLLLWSVIPHLRYHATVVTACVVSRVVMSCMISQMRDHTFGTTQHFTIAYSSQSKGNNFTGCLFWCVLLSRSLSLSLYIYIYIYKILYIFKSLVVYTDASIVPYRPCPSLKLWRRILIYFIKKFPIT